MEKSLLTEQLTVSIKWRVRLYNLVSIWGGLNSVVELHDLYSIIKFIQSS